MSEKLFVTDVDGVLLDFSSKVKNWFENYYQKELEPGTRWNFEEAFGVPKPVVAKMWDDIWTHSLQPFEGAGEFLSELRQSGYKVVALSSRKVGPAREASARDLGLSGLRASLDALHFVEPGQSKGPLLQQWGAAAFLDDHMPNLFDALKYQAGIKCFLRDAPYNTSQDIDPPYTRVRSFYDVIEGL